MEKNSSCGRLNGIVCAMLLVAAWLPAARPAAGQGEEFLWTGEGVDDSIHEPGNWTTNGIVALVAPGEDDWARFNDAAVPLYGQVDWTVDFSASVTHNAFSLGQINRNTTGFLDLDGNTYTLTATGSGRGSAGLFVERALLIVTNGHLLTEGSVYLGSGNGDGGLILTGSNTVWTSQYTAAWAVLMQSDANRTTHPVALRVEKGAQATFAGMRIVNAGLYTGVVEVVGHGSVVTNTGTLETGRRGAVSTITLADGARWEQSGAISEMYEETRADGAFVLNLDGGKMNISHSGGLDLTESHAAEMNFTLYSGATDASLTVGRGVQLGTNTFLGVEVAEDFSMAPGPEVFTLLRANSEEGGYELIGTFLDADGEPIDDGALLTLEGENEMVFEFVANYTADQRFTLTTIPPPRGTLFLVR